MGFLDRLLERPEPAPGAGRGVVRLCVEGALREAEAAGCTSVALPVFGAGHANLPFDDALDTIARTLLDVPTANLDSVLLVILHPHQVKRAEAILSASADLLLELIQIDLDHVELSPRELVQELQPRHPSNLRGLATADPSLVVPLDSSGEAQLRSKALRRLP
ncbi:MAG TPA: macro domain-containing protein [Thermoanaerobaculia bacterium]|nr:macro domain-containing protein [Thermoanaerobaculia bacterium]